MKTKNDFNKINNLCDKLLNAFYKRENKDFSIKKCREKFEKELLKLKSQLESSQNTIDKLKSDILQIKDKSFKTDKYNVKITNTSKVVFKGNIDDLPNKYVTTKVEKYVDKSAVKKDFKDGKLKDGKYNLYLVDGASIVIKDNHKR